MVQTFNPGSDNLSLCFPIKTNMIVAKASIAKNIRLSQML